MNVYSVHYADFMSITRYALINMYGYAAAGVGEYWRAGQLSYNAPRRTPEEAEKFKQECASRFKTKCVSLFKKGEYYSFIITNHQLQAFIEDIKFANIEKDIVYQSSVAGVNINYIDEGPKLHVFLIHFQGD